MDQQGAARFGGESGLRADAQIVRGPGSWAAIWGAFGFAIAIEGALIPMAAPPLKWPCNVGLNVGPYAVGGVLTVVLFTRGWFQKYLLDVKKRFEEKPRQ